MDSNASPNQKQIARVKYAASKCGVRVQWYGKQTWKAYTGSPTSIQCGCRGRGGWVSRSLCDTPFCENVIVPATEDYEVLASGMTLDQIDRWVRDYVYLMENDTARYHEAALLEAEKSPASLPAPGASWVWSHAIGGFVDASTGEKVR